MAVWEKFIKSCSKILTFLTLPPTFQIIMKVKRFFSPPNVSLAAAFLSFASAPHLMAALPSSPLNGEFITSSNEYVYADWWWKVEIGSEGVWNIVGDLAQVNWGYEGGHNKILTGTGTLNIGSETEGGSLYIMGQNPPSSDHWYRIVDFNGTVNVGKMGAFSFGGTYISRWGMISYIDTLNVNGGMVSVMSETQNNSYFCLKNLAVRDGGTFESSQDLQTAGGGVWDLHSGGLSAPVLRVGSGSFTLNLRSEDVLNNLPQISFDENTGTNFRINVFADNSIGEELEFNGNAVLELSVADGAALTIRALSTKNDVHSVQNAEIIFYDYRADAVLFEDPYIFVEDDRLCLSTYETYVKLTAYDGEGNLLRGVWTYEWDDAAGLGRLVLNAVPEPAAVSTVLGAFALAFAARRERKK